MIPHILHQTWKTREIPDVWRPFRRTWQEQHPDWQHRLWTDADLRHLVEETYPSFLPIFDGYRCDISRVDAARYLILERYGGVYVDLDFECLRPVGPLLADHEVVLGLEPRAHLETPKAARRGLNRIVCNAFMASTPGHAFWANVRSELHAHRNEMDPLDATGPFMLTDALRRWPRPDSILLAPEEALYPLTKGEVAAGQLIDASVGERLGAAFAVHHWSGSWVQDYIDDCARRRSRGRRPTEAIDPARTAANEASGRAPQQT